MLALELGVLHFKINSTFYGKGNWTNHLASTLQYIPPLQWGE